jgi:hypothetical protein
MVEQTTAKEEAIRTEVATPKEKKKGFWSKFLNFLMMGGFLVILILIVAIAIGISLLTAKPA